MFVNFKKIGLNLFLLQNKTVTRYITNFSKNGYKIYSVWIGIKFVFSDNTGKVIKYSFSKLLKVKLHNSLISKLLRDFCSMIKFCVLIELLNILKKIGSQPKNLDKQ